MTDSVVMTSGLSDKLGDNLRTNLNTTTDALVNDCHVSQTNDTNNDHTVINNIHSNTDDIDDEDIDVDITDRCDETDTHSQTNNLVNSSPTPSSSTSPHNESNELHIKADTTAGAVDVDGSHSLGGQLIPNHQLNGGHDCDISSFASSPPKTADTDPHPEPISDVVLSDNNSQSTANRRELCPNWTTTPPSGTPSPSPTTASDGIKRVELDERTIMSLTADQFAHHWRQQQQYITAIECQLRQLNRDKSDLISLRESEEKLKHQQLEANRRENVLVMRLTTKEQEMQDYLNQIQELKQSQVPSTGQLQSALIDPAVNLMFDKMKREVDTSRARVEEMQNELNAWKFTPDSTTGKRLMAKCRLLYQENEELGRLIASGRIAKLEGELALQKSFSEELKKSQSEMDEFLLELDEEVEGMQNTIYYLQQQLKEAKDKLSKYESPGADVVMVAVDGDDAGAADYQPNSVAFGVN